jgi:hypothetical protein
MAVLRLTRIAHAALVAAALAAGPALASPGGLVAPPAGWRPDPEQESELARRFSATAHFGGLAATTAAEVHVPPRSSVALCVTRATAALPDPGAAAGAARAALDELRATTRRVSLTGAAAEEQAWQERIEPDARQVTAILHWREPANHTVGNARIVVVSDGRRIAAVTGECLTGDGGELGAANACIQQLATLDPGIAPADRVALAPAPAERATAPATAPGVPSAPSVEPPPSMAPAPDTLPPAPPRLDDATRDRTETRARLALPPVVIPQDRPAADHRPAYLGLGLIVLAVVFWWNRRRRDRFEQEDGDGDGDGDGTEPRTERARRRAASDADADDLHAAAHGDGPPPTADPAASDSPRKPSP